MRTEFRYGKKIRQLREERAWTHEQLAAIAGVEPRTIQRVEGIKPRTKRPCRQLRERLTSTLVNCEQRGALPSHVLSRHTW
jgi:transcriptional regulator with XRE-family HTH domain